MSALQWKPSWSSLCSEIPGHIRVKNVTRWHICQRQITRNCVIILINRVSFSYPFGSRIFLATTTEMQRATDKPAATMNRTPEQQYIQIAMYVCMSLPNHKVRFFSPQPHPSLHCKNTDTRLIASRGVPPYAPTFAGTHCAYQPYSRMDGQAELTWPTWA